MQFPNIDVWPGDRDWRLWPNPQVGPDGGIQFTVAYPLRNGCHACASAGQAIFNWNLHASARGCSRNFVSGDARSATATVAVRPFRIA